MAPFSTPKFDPKTPASALPTRLPKAGEVYISQVDSISQWILKCLFLDIDVDKWKSCCGFRILLFARNSS